MSNEDNLFSNFFTRPLDTPELCEKAIKNGVLLAIIQAIVTLIFGNQLFGFSYDILLVNLIIMIILSIFLYLKSRIASIILLCSIIISQFYSLIQNPNQSHKIGAVGFIMAILIISVYYNSIRATFSWHSKFKPNESNKTINNNFSKSLIDQNPKSKEPIKTTQNGLEIAKELSIIYDELLNQNSKEFNEDYDSDFIDFLFDKFETNKRYNNFRKTVLATCLISIVEEKDLDSYIKDLEQQVKQLRIKLNDVLIEYKDSKNFWIELIENHIEQSFEVGYILYNERFMTTQLIVLMSFKENFLKNEM